MSAHKRHNDGGPRSERRLTAEKTILVLHGQTRDERIESDIFGPPPA